MRATISFESSDLKAKIGQTVLGSFDEHGLGEYLIVAKKKVSSFPETYRFYIRWALDDPTYAHSRALQDEQARRQAIVIANRDKAFQKGREVFPELAARYDHLMIRADENSGHKRHRFVHRANVVYAKIVDRVVGVPDSHLHTELFSTEAK